MTILLFYKLQESYKVFYILLILQESYKVAICCVLLILQDVYKINFILQDKYLSCKNLVRNVLTI